ncbi:flagellar M-ring protein FliF [Ideonella sp. 4Y11]|uniref:Flagellar M-ring protein n=1 Tax=Ideonella aquatica TaxID=2824119 RepID=A0A941BID0_9BURK|nr:flagellar basal-body MS-ring/collar protein FliF [Ideonella aquatica]MBQ0958452.1 flagellar M-ring protein FliF [Ideonella aquatica]
MDAVVESPTPLVPAQPPGLMARLAALPQATRLKLGIGLAGLLATVVAMALWASQGDWKVLYANLPDKEAGAIIAQLSQMNVPYRHTDGGAAIMVPADRVYDLKMKLAAAGLPKASVTGNELLDNARFGQTDRQERMNMQRALEGELVRTITRLDGVQEARVHLALPNQNGFFREQQKASASVMLTLHPGRSLDRAQAASIVHLVSSSVPELNPKAVSVLDQTGTLLSGPDETARNLNEQELQYQRQIETTYLKRVQEILEPVLGHDNMRATVTAEIDFTQTEATQEQYRPNQGDQPAAVRSQQTLESTQPGTPVPTGVPGAATNQPPTPATAPVNGASAPLQANQSGQNGGGSRREAVTNYEVDKTTRVTRAPVGSVKRLNAAVVVNYRLPTPDPKAKSKTEPKPEALPQEEIDKITALVQEAVGYSKERGDSIKVISAPFRADDTPKPDELPLWKQPWVLDLLRAGAVPAALAIVALGLIFGAIRPAIQAAKPQPVEDAQAAADTAVAQLDAVVDDGLALPGTEAGMLPALESPQENAKLEAARRLARDNPQAVANIMREWVTGEAVA